MFKKTTKRNVLFCSLLLFVLCVGGIWLRSCAQWHTRPRGHYDIAFNISHKGDRIVFTAQGQGGRDLYLLDLKTKKVTRVAETPDYEGDPSFSPDDKSILYVAGVPGDRADHIFLRAVDGSWIKQISADDYNDLEPAFSPDGSRIVFTRNHQYRWGGLSSSWGHDSEVYIVNVDGTPQRRLTNAGYTMHPQFTPDGKSIVVTAMTKTFAADVYQMDIIQGQLPGQMRKLTKDGTARSSSFSPNGRQILIATIHGVFRLMAIDGSDVTQVGTKDLGAEKPVFSPDGKTLFFLSSRGEPIKENPSSRTSVGTGLWQIDIDGKNLRRIAGYHLFNNPLTWKPEESTSASE